MISHEEAIILAERTLEDKDFNVWLNSHTIKNYVDGGVGRAYFLEKKVIKFTRDPIEAMIAKLLFNVYDLPPIWAILRDYIDEAPVHIKEAADIVGTVLDNNPSLEYFPEEDDLALKVIYKYKKDISLIPCIREIMVMLNDIYYKTGYLPDDVGPTNIGLCNGKVVLIDIGPAFSLKRPEEYLQKIKLNRQKLGLVPIKCADETILYCH